MTILETERLVLRELDSQLDAEFVFDLLNTPKFLKHIGDRGVRTVDEAARFVEDRYRASYREHGYGLYAVDLRAVDTATDRARQSIGICGFVKRDIFELPDIGFAFLPEHEGQGYGFESAAAILEYGRDVLGFTRVLAITSQDNHVSVKLLEKLGFVFQWLHTMPAGDTVKLFQRDL